MMTEKQLFFVIFIYFLFVCTGLYFMSNDAYLVSNIIFSILFVIPPVAFQYWILDRKHPIMAISSFLIATFLILLTFNTFGH